MLADGFGVSAMPPPDETACPSTPAAYDAAGGLDGTWIYRNERLPVDRGILPVCGGQIDVGMVRGGAETVFRSRASSDV